MIHYIIFSKYFCLLHFFIIIKPMNSFCHILLYKSTFKSFYNFLQKNRKNLILPLCLCYVKETVQNVRCKETDVEKYVNRS